MDDYLAYFLELRFRLRGRREAVAIVNRCLRIIAEAEGGSEATRERLAREIALFRSERRRCSPDRTYPRLPANRCASRSRRKTSATWSTKTRVLAGSSVRLA